jgi:hypothetical protein
MASQRGRGDWRYRVLAWPGGKEEDKAGMSTLLEETQDSAPNPLDLVEEIIGANEWPFERAGANELIAEISGRWCEYRLHFGWLPEIGAMAFSCGFDMKVSERKREAIFALLALCNERLWIGHFDMSAQGGAPCYRHAMLLRGGRGASVEQLEDLVDIALTECERFYPAFQFVLWGGKAAGEAIEAAVIETAGEA